MVGQINRRRVKKRKRPRENSKVKFTAVLAIMVIAVALGYLTARFVIGPLLGYNADESPVKIANESGEDTSSGSDKDGAAQEGSDESKQEEQPGDTQVSTAPDDGYALQFGVFSSKEAAENLKTSLAEKGIETKIIETDNVYKVISPVINTKDEAIDKLNDIKDKDVEDVFIASF